MRDKKDKRDEALWLETTESWRKEREAALRGPWSWLSLSALIWLENTGGMTVGGEGPSLSPWRQVAEMGRIEADGRRWRFRGTDGAEMLLNDDISGEPVYLEREGLRIGVITRSLRGLQRSALRVWDSRSPRRDQMTFAWFDPDPRWILPARFIPGEAPITIPDALGGEEENLSPGSLEFRVHGRDLRLRVLDGGGDSWFAIFHDATSGRKSGPASYPSARYLTIEKKPYLDPEDYPVGNAADAPEVLRVDFNRAVSPPCAYSPFATCPFAPEENYLDMPVTAGEIWLKSDGR
jgi:uncharacterized protein (DUF1684 family)